MLWRSATAKRRPSGFIEPCIPTPASKPPVGPQWVHEIKHDGYRLIVRKEGDRVRLFTRRGYDWTDRYPLIAKVAAALPARAAVIDGEAVCCDEAGVANFERLHSRAHDGQSSMALTIGGSRTRRKAELEKLLRKSAAGIACKLGFEGSSESAGSTLIDRVQARLG